MKRKGAHRFVLLSVVILIVASGCATKNGAGDSLQPAATSSKVTPSGEATATNERKIPPAVEPLNPDIESEFSAAIPSAHDDEAASLSETEAAKVMTDPNPDTMISSDSDADIFSDIPVGPDAEKRTVDRPTYDELSPCYVPPKEDEQWLDKGQKRVYQTVCSTVSWFDGFFGDRSYDSAYRETFGRVSLSQFWDQYDGFDTRFRFRAKLPLPALNSRTNLLIGRGDERELIEEQKQTPSDTIPSNFNQVEDDSFLFGLGYSKNRGLKRGFDLSVGVKVRFPPEPYVKARFRRAWNLTDSTLFRLSPVVYWKLDEGFGSTLNGTLDNLLSENLVLRWSGSVNVSEDRDIEGFAWNNWISLYQALANRKALSYHAFVLGETKADVQTQNFGFEVRFRRKVIRKWLFLDLVTSYSWPRFLLEEEREGNFGIGAGLEMFFGPVPDVQLR